MNAFARLRRLVRPFVPGRLRRALIRSRERRLDRLLAGKPRRELFSAIYARSLWGQSEGDGFWSGSGSRDPVVADPYVERVGAWLTSHSERPAMVDLGCGDFAIGCRLRPLCSGFVAVDIVPELIARNRKVFADLDVDFHCLDLVSEPLPPGDVAILRQVLQHLCNEDIAAVLAKLGEYREVVITEHLPSGSFVPNRPKPTGGANRLYLDSGIVPDAPPFGLRAIEKRELCAVEHGGGVIVTMLYRMR